MSSVVGLFGDFEGFLLGGDFNVALPSAVDFFSVGDFGGLDFFSVGDFGGLNFFSAGNFEGLVFFLGDLVLGDVRRLSGVTLSAHGTDRLVGKSVLGDTHLSGDCGVSALSADDRERDRLVGESLFGDTCTTGGSGLVVGDSGRERGLVVGESAFGGPISVGDCGSGDLEPDGEPCVVGFGFGGVRTSGDPELEDEQLFIGDPFRRDFDFEWDRLVARSFGGDFDLGDDGTVTSRSGAKEPLEAPDEVDDEADSLGSLLRLGLFWEGFWIDLRDILFGHKMDEL